MIKNFFLIFVMLICITTPVLALDFENKYIESYETYNYYEWESSDSYHQQYNLQPLFDLISPVGTVNSGFNGLSFMSFSSDDGFVTGQPEFDNELVHIYRGGTKIGEGLFSSEHRYSRISHTRIGFDWWLHITDFNSGLLPASSSTSITLKKADGSAMRTDTGMVARYTGHIEQEEFKNPNLPYFVQKSPANLDWVVQGRSQVVVTPYWENTVEIKDYDKTLSYLTLTRDNYISTLNITNSDNEVLFFSDTVDDYVEYPIMSDGLKFELISAYGKIYSESFFVEEEYDLSVTKSKDKVLVINEEETYYLKGLTSLDNIKTIIWTTQKLKDDGSRDENYYPTGERYQRINSTHFEKLVMANGAVLSEDILPVSSDFLEFSESFSEDGKYKTSCDIFETSASGLGILIGSPYVLTEVSDIGELVKIKVITINSETAGTISNCVLNLYKLNSTGETLVQNVLMPSSSTNINLEFGELYRFEATKTGYVDAEVIKQITTPDIIILYLKPASGDGFTTASFTIRDTDKNRLADVKIEMDSKTRYTNTGGIATFTELNQNSTYTYTITHPDYVEETGTIETELEDLVNIDVVLYKEAEVYPTPTETEGPSWINEKPSNMKESFLLSFYMVTGIEDLETLKLLSGVLLSALIGIIAASITKDGTGFLAGGIIGFIGAIGLGWIPIWLLIALIVITGCYFIFSRGDS